MPPRPSTWDPAIGFRLPRKQLERVLSLRDILGGIESATTSATMRELVALALVVFDGANARRVAAYARRAGISRDAAWERVVDVGIDALESGEG